MLLLVAAAAKYATKYIYIQLVLLRDCIIIKFNSIFLQLPSRYLSSPISVGLTSFSLTPHADRQSHSFIWIYDFHLNTVQFITCENY